MWRNILINSKEYVICQERKQENLSDGGNNNLKRKRIVLKEHNMDISDHKKGFMQFRRAAVRYMICIDID